MSISRPRGERRFPRRRAGPHRGIGGGAAPAAALLVYERVLPAVPSTIGQIRTELDAALARHRVGVPRRADIALVATEATTNVVLHADPPGCAGPLRITGVLAGLDLVVAVGDEGRGIEACTANPGLGHGLRIIRALADEVSISSGRGTRLAALFRDTVSGRPPQSALRPFRRRLCGRRLAASVAATPTTARDGRRRATGPAPGERRDEGWCRARVDDTS